MTMATGYLAPCSRCRQMLRVTKEDYYQLDLSHEIICKTCYEDLEAGQDMDDIPVMTISFWHWGVALAISLAIMGMVAIILKLIWGGGW